MVSRNGLKDMLIGVGIGMSMGIISGVIVDAIMNSKERYNKSWEEAWERSAYPVRLTLVQEDDNNTPDNQA